MARKKSKLWEEVEAAVAAGKIPEIRFPKAAKVIQLPRPTGRPRTRPIGIKHVRHWTWKMKTPSGRAMRCRNPGCQREVSAREAVLTCSRPQCFIELRNYCRITLDILEGRMPGEEYPIQYRALRNYGKKLSRFAAINKKMNERKKAA